MCVDFLSAGHICHKIHCEKGEYKGPCGSTVVVQALATCLCCWYGLRCCCPCRSTPATYGWSNVGQSPRVFWKALSRKIVTGTSNDLELYSQQHSIACFNFILQVVHLPELQYIHSLPATSLNVVLKHNYAKSLVHPLTLTMGRYVVGDRFHNGLKSSSHKPDTCKYHNMRLCPQLTQFQSVTSEVINSKI